MTITRHSISFYLFVLYIFPMYFTISWSLYSHQPGAWCPYQMEKLVPCRVRNGTEPYYGANICWRNENGSYACNKKILGYRAKYTTTYKKIMETKFKCCPGRDGSDCENECFNCTTFKKLGDRLNTQERRISRLEKSLQQQKSTADRFQYKDYANQNSVFSPTSNSQQESGTQEGNTPQSSLAYATLNLRVQTILDEFREMQSRIRYLENEVARLNTQVDELTLSTNFVYDYGTGSTNKDTRNSNQVISKDSPMISSTTPTHSSTMTNDEDSYNERRNDDSQVSGRRHHDDSDHYSNHHHRHSHTNHHTETETETSTVAPSHTQQSHRHQQSHHDHSPGKSENTIRVLEENLERGDIASTLNDDYGDELYNDNSTEQYIDQLHTKREQYLP